MKTTTTLSFKKTTFVLLVMFFALLSFSTKLQAQSILVKGIVKGQTYEETEVLNGANIFLKGTNTGTSTNKKGEFTFPESLKVGDVIEVSYLGYITKKIKITAKSTNLTIILQEDDNQMLGALNSNKRYKSKRNKE